jgi:hypothetical protein
MRSNHSHYSTQSLIRGSHWEILCSLRNFEHQVCQLNVSMADRRLNQALKDQQFANRELGSMLEEHIHTLEQCQQETVAAHETLNHQVPTARHASAAGNLSVMCPSFYGVPQAIDQLLSVYQALTDAGHGRLGWESSTRFLDSMNLTITQCRDHAISRPETMQSRDMLESFEILVEPLNAFKTFVKRKRLFQNDALKTAVRRIPKCFKDALEEAEGKVASLRTAILSPIHKIQATITLQML